jgi:hypothetical protein
MRVIVCGGRDFDDFMAVDSALRHVAPSVVVHGGARGADSLAGEWAALHGVSCVVFPADWTKHGKAAGPIRNQQMIDAGADLVLAFPGGRGAADCVDRARVAGITVVDLREGR